MAQTHEERLEAQRQYVASHNCPHIVQCATDEQLRDRAVELIRSGNAHDAFLGMAMLTGPCAKKGETT